MLHDRKRDDKKLLNLLKRHCDAEQELFSLFSEENVEIQDLKDKMFLLQELRDETLSLFFRKEEKDGDTKILNISGNIIKEKEFDVETVKSFNTAKEEIVSVYKAIANNKTPILNLNLIKNFLVNISQYFLSPTFKKEDEDIEGIIVLSQKEHENSQLILKNGRRIVITPRNNDFTDFNHNELIEILRFFDTLISDSSIDHLRTEIVKQINAISNVSLIKF
jgi:hypothetical protein